MYTSAMKNFALSSTHQYVRHKLFSPLGAIDVASTSYTKYKESRTTIFFPMHIQSVREFVKMMPLGEIGTWCEDRNSVSIV
jgi:hypothetical protein